MVFLDLGDCTLDPATDSIIGERLSDEELDDPASMTSIKQVTFATPEAARISAIMTHSHSKAVQLQSSEVTDESKLRSKPQRRLQVKSVQRWSWRRAKYPSPPWISPRTLFLEMVMHWSNPMIHLWRLTLWTPMSVLTRRSHGS